jgi:hypothetical protein
MSIFCTGDGAQMLAEWLQALSQQGRAAQIVEQLSAVSSFPVVSRSGL